MGTLWISGVLLLICFAVSLQAMTLRSNMDDDIDSGNHGTKELGMSAFIYPGFLNSEIVKGSETQGKLLRF